MSHVDNPEHDAGFRPPSHRSRFLSKRDRRPTFQKTILAAADPMAILEWEAEHGLTVASVSRYILRIGGGAA